jgi:ribosomal protein L7/L12
LRNSQLAQLKKQRHEMFAQELVLAARTGATNGQAYTRAGYTSNGKAAEASAARMLADAKNGIAKRVREIIGNGAKRAEVTVETLLDRLERNITNADAAGNHGAVNGAVKIMADLRGLLVNKVEVGGPGEFAQCQSFDDVVDAMLSEMSPQDALELLGEFRQKVEERAASQATLVPELPARRSNEAAEGLALFRSRPKVRRN